MKTTLHALLLILPTTAGCGIWRSGESKIDLTTAEEKCSHLLPRTSFERSPLRYASCEQIDAEFLAVDSYSQCLVQNRGPDLQAREAVANSETTSVGKSSGGSVASPSGGSVASPSGDLLGNVRHEGVDEDDFVKISANQIFVSAGNKINVLDRKTKKHLGALTTDTLNSTLFLRNNKLIVLEAQALSLFEIADNSLPRLLVKRDIKGWHVESRLVDNHLIMISSDDIRSERSQESTERKIDFTKIDCMQTFQPVGRVSDVGTGTVGLRMNRSGLFSGSNVTRLESYSLNDLDSRSMYFLDTHRLYMTAKNIYLFGTVADSAVGHKPDRTSPRERTHLRKIPLLANGSFGEPVSGFIPGRIKDVWALNELSGGEVAVATSSGNLWDGSALNHFQILSEKSNSLETIGRTEDYGAKEDIRSVRFVNNIAYVVTFKKTDPLFAIDVSKPEEPKILGELKIPGFSTYMHPLNSERLVGLGFDATEVNDVAYYQGLQLSLFDVSQPEEMNRKDVKIFGSRGSNSLATIDHKAFFLDTAEQWVGFPVTLFQGCGGEMVCTPKPSMPFLPEVLSSSVVTGALLVRVRNDAFEGPLLISHNDLLGSECAGSNPWGASWSSPSGTNDIERILKVDGELLTLSRGALKTFRISDRLEILQSTRWSDNCNQPIPEPVPL